MATHTLTTLIDDIDGTAAESTVSFSIDGLSYEIDLSKKNANALEKSLAPFVEAARKVSGRSRRASARSSAAANKEQVQAMREWARAHGYEVADRGRISAAIQEAYNAS